MANVTDTAFRRLIGKYGPPDVCYTEFMSCDGLCSAGQDRLLPELSFSDLERPLLLHLFGANPDGFYACARMARDVGFDGVDINTGCPDRAVLRQHAGAALINDPGRMAEIVAAAKEGAAPLPVSIKTRLGYERETLEPWLGCLIECAPVAIAFHARTARELSKVPADWQQIARAVELAARSGILIIGNGDITDVPEARQAAAASGVDGVMLGRAIFGMPWLFSAEQPTRTLEAVLEVMLEHALLFDRLLGFKNFAQMRRHFKAYVAGFAGAKALRVALMQTNNPREVAELVRPIIGLAGIQAAAAAAEELQALPPRATASEAKQALRLVSTSSGRPAYATDQSAPSQQVGGR